MNKEIADVGTLSQKLGGLFTIMILDFVCESAFQFLNSKEHDLERIVSLRQQRIFFYVSGGLTIILQFALFFWAITLVWKTFLFRFTFMKKLFCQEFPMLLFVLLHFLIVIGEKVFRVVSNPILTIF